MLAGIQRRAIKIDAMSGSAFALRQKSRGKKDNWNSISASSSSSLPPMSFLKLGLTLVLCAFAIALLNLYMNLTSSYQVPSFRLDLSPDGDVIGFHQFDLPHQQDEHQHVKLANDPRKRHRSPANYRSNRAPHCSGICPPRKSGRLQVEHVASLVERRLASLSPKTFLFTERLSGDGRVRHQLLSEIDAKSARVQWRQLAQWVGPRQMIPSNLDQSLLTQISHFLAHASVIAASLPRDRSLPYRAVRLELLGGLKALWLPHSVSSDVDGGKENTSSSCGTAVTGGPVDGVRPDANQMDIVAFHLGRLLHLNRAFVAVGRCVHLQSDVYANGNAELTESFVASTPSPGDGSSQLCLVGKCLHCSQEAPLCSGDDDLPLAGSLLVVPVDRSIESFHHPWYRSGEPTRLDSWQTDVDFCGRVLADPRFGKTPLFLDLIDVAVVDFLLANDQRNKVDLFAGVEPKMMLLTNIGSPSRKLGGISNSNSANDDLSILAPLYQCCRVRTKLYSTLMRYAELNLANLLNNLLKVDPLYPNILTRAQFEAINRRARKVLTVIAICIEDHGSSLVLIDDGF